ncbi:hypothetical protein RHMOL_Rhmol11G0275100 [Rhododendron molle]|uniref:Uncharacterized protein n=1 Tax=Rhododendron molle TaxID=49168 RepID=A0ACC0LWZ9_RHOML|nr:hypothetical protein RHMOL_Rhmol11G0275100 [Rhododendron molle]
MGGFVGCPPNPVKDEATLFSEMMDIQHHSPRVPQRNQFRDAKKDGLLVVRLNFHSCQPQVKGHNASVSNRHEFSPEAGALLHCSSKAIKN